MAEAVAEYREALRLRPDYPEASKNLGNALVQTGETAAAIACFRHAAGLQPHNADARINLARALQMEGEFAQAVTEFRAALQLRPHDPHAASHLADALQSAGDLDAAIAQYRIALLHNPADAAIHNNLGAALQRSGRLDDAAASFRTALAFQPGYPQALSNLGSVLKDQGLIEDAVASFRQAASLAPDNIDFASNLVYMLHFDPRTTDESLAEELARWNARFAAPAAEASPPKEPRDPGRPLRIGWVSPDFRRHPIGRFLLPLFAAHDKAEFEFFCYSDVKAEDEITAALRKHAAQWRETSRLAHDGLAALIRRDEIDILIDLTMHMQGCRLPVFARKPAPVQITYLAYASSTGLPQMDYRLTDASIDPVDALNPFVEEPVRLNSYWCYAPDPAAPAVGRLPALARGHITFGNLNNLCKSSPEALRAWMKILQAVPNSHLLLHCPQGSPRERVQQLFSSGGIASARLRFADLLPFPQYMALYNQIDIALDPFPYSGGTTSCDALWMGVPLVTLAGKTTVGRGGVSILSQLSLSNWIASAPEEYVALAIRAAQDQAQLATLRQSLRRRMTSSPLTSAAQFASDLQRVLRKAEPVE
jgi:predicted O-linked N-acetylglucosamine transferase (SPINDLY family)